jgi:hypothetical protein
MPNPGKPNAVKEIIGSRNLVKVKPVLASKGLIPDPPRRLEESGIELWNTAISLNWVSNQADLPVLAVLCEQLDERDLLRSFVLDNVDDWRQRASLRKLEDSINAAFAKLLMTPADRVRAGVAEVKAQSKLEELLERKAARG